MFILRTRKIASRSFQSVFGFRLDSTIKWSDIKFSCRKLSTFQYEQARLSAWWGWCGGDRKEWSVTVTNCHQRVAVRSAKNRSRFENLDLIGTTKPFMKYHRCHRGVCVVYPCKLRMHPSRLVLAPQKHEVGGENTWKVEVVIQTGSLTPFENQSHKKKSVLARFS